MGVELIRALPLWVRLPVSLTWRLGAGMYILLTDSGGTLSGNQPLEPKFFRTFYSGFSRVS